MKEFRSGYNPQEGFQKVDGGAHTRSMVEYLREISELPTMQNIRRLAQGILSPRRGERIADAGCGIGTDTVELLMRYPSLKSVVAFDPSKAMLEAANDYIQESGVGVSNKVNLVQADIEHLGVASNSFDGVISHRVFQHLSSPYRAMAELHRVLKPNGRVVITDTQWNSLTVEGVSEESARTLRQACGREGYVVNTNLAKDLDKLMEKCGLVVQTKFPVRGEFKGLDVLNKLVWIDDSLNRAEKSGVIKRDQAEQCREELSQKDPEKISTILDIYIACGEKIA